MEPLDGMTVLAEYTDKFEADLAAGWLGEAGITATVLSDPAHQVAPHYVTNRSHQLLVADRDADPARQALNRRPAASTDPRPAATGLARRPLWFRVLAWLLVLGLLIPLAIGLIIFLFGL